MIERLTSYNVRKLSVLDIFKITLLYFGVGLLSILIFEIIGYEEGMPIPLEILYAFAVYVLPVIFIMRKYRDKSEVNIQKIDLCKKDYILFILILLGEFIMFFGFAYYIPEAASDAENMHYITEFIAACIFAPVAEEILFRGVLLGGLAKRYNHKIAIIVSGVIFGFAHLGIARGIAISISGIILGYIYYKVGSLKPVIFMHAFWNILVTILGELGEFYIYYPDNSAIAIVVSIIYIVVGLIIIYILFKKLNLKNRLKTISQVEVV